MSSGEVTTDGSEVLIGPYISPNTVKSYEYYNVSFDKSGNEYLSDLVQWVVNRDLEQEVQTVDATVSPFTDSNGNVLAVEDLLLYVEWKPNFSVVPPSTPNLVSPDDGAEKYGFGNWFFDWDASNGTEPIQYNLQVAKNASFPDPKVDITIDNTSKIVGSYKDGPTYYWRVRAQNEQYPDAKSQWSEVRSFTVELPPSPPLHVKILNEGYDGPYLELAWDASTSSDVTNDIYSYAIYKCLYDKTTEECTNGGFLTGEGDYVPFNPQYRDFGVRDYSETVEDGTNLVAKYYIKAVDENGNESRESNRVSAEVQEPGPFSNEADSLQTAETP